MTDRPAIVDDFVRDPAASPSVTSITITARFRSRSVDGLIHRARRDASGATVCSCWGYAAWSKCWHARALDQLVLDVETSVSSGSICDHRDQPDDVAHPAHAG